jgi:(p)ppGpp synthase/HD superfamily hydrolase
MAIQTKLEQAETLAREAHKGQTRNLPGGGVEDYVNHPLRVAALVAEHDLGQAETIVAILHDVLEDTEVGWCDIQQQFGNTVAAGVDLLTKGTGHWSNRRYKARLELAPAWVQAVKLADRIDNIRSIQGVDGWDEGRVQHYLEDSRELLNLVDYDGGDFIYSLANMLAEELRAVGVEV